MPKSEQYLIIKGTLFISVAMLLSFLIAYELMGKTNIDLGQTSWNINQKLQAKNDDATMTSHEVTTSGSRTTGRSDPEAGPNVSNQSADALPSTKTPDGDISRDNTTLKANISRAETTSSGNMSVEHEVTERPSEGITTIGSMAPDTKISTITPAKGQLQTSELPFSTFQFTTTPSSETNNTSNATTAHQNQTTAAQTTTEDPRPPCLREDYRLSSTCEVGGYLAMTFGEDVTLEDISDMVFSRPTLDRLRHVCEPGSWCLEDDWQLVADDNDFLDFCFIVNCLVETMPDDCLDEKRKLTLSTLLLLCDTATGNSSDICFLATRKMTHVTFSLAENPDELADMNDCGISPDNCSATCNQLAKGLHCLCEICEHNTDLIKEYTKWNWFLEDDDAMTTCGITNDTDCSFLRSPTESWFDSIWGKLKSVDKDDDSNVKIISLITAAGILFASGLAVSLWACFRKGSVIRSYSRRRVEYMEVEPEEDYYD